MCCELETILKEHASAHPVMEITDAVKLVYQHTLGGGHMIPDPSRSLARLEAELAGTPADDGPLTEDLGGGLVRLRLAGMVGVGLSAEAVNRLFVLSANMTHGSIEALKTNLEILRRVTAAGVFAFDGAALDAYLAAYAQQGYPAVSHSETYRAAYGPAYRVVRRDLLRALPVILAIDGRLAECGRVLAALDGRCASGKSTLGALLAEVYGAALFHMDDFFLRPEQRTPERLAEPGGNVDRERFAAEVLAPLKAGIPFTYRPYDCTAKALAAPVAAKPAAVTVVEGSYALHPELRDAYDVRIFLTVGPETQMRRIRARSGEALAARFVAEWIPMEERYFSALRVPECCHAVISTEDGR